MCAGGEFTAAASVRGTSCPQAGVKPTNAVRGQEPAVATRPWEIRSPPPPPPRATTCREKPAPMTLVLLLTFLSASAPNLPKSELENQWAERQGGGEIEQTLNIAP